MKMVDSESAILNDFERILKKYEVSKLLASVPERALAKYLFDCILNLRGVMDDIKPRGD